MLHKRFQTCHAQGVIDAEIAERAILDGNYLNNGRLIDSLSAAGA